MLRNAASKAMWVGRTTAAVIGLAIALAIVFGVATMALAAVPGDPFKLGKVNSINRISTLVGTATSPMLRVVNKGTGTALDLRVQQGKPPLTTNSTGKVSRLNADMVDGIHASAFLPKGGKAADSDKLDGKDSSDFMTYNSTLKPGQTLTGVWGAGAGGTNTYAAAAIEFRPKLPAAIPTSNAHYVSGTSAPNCPGQGQADPGHLCVYKTVIYGMTFEGFGDPVEGYSSFAIREQGTIAYFPSNVSGRSWVRGTWAVTAPLATQQFQQELQEQPSRQPENTATGQVPR